MFGWQRELLIPCGIVLIGSNQIGSKASRRLRAEEAVGKALHGRLLSYRGRVAEPRTSNVSPTDLKQQKLQRRQSLGAPRGQCDRRYIANPEFNQRAEADLIFAWSGVLLITGSRWGVLNEVDRIQPSGPSVQHSCIAWKQSALTSPDSGRRRLARVSDPVLLSQLERY